MKHIELKTVAEIGNFVREERKRQNVTQLQLAGLAGTGIRFVSDLENGKGTIQVQNQWGQVCIASRGKMKNFCMEVFFECKRR